jgi:hypothetical protein
MQEHGRRAGGAVRGEDRRTDAEVRMQEGYTQSSLRRGGGRRRIRSSSIVTTACSICSRCGAAGTRRHIGRRREGAER